jgi:hypothetical protein
VDPGVSRMCNHTFVDLARLRLALSLLVPRIFANHHHATVPANHLALVADLLDARLDLHRASF